MSSSNSTLTNVFFDQLLTFLGELKGMYPDDADFPLGITSIKLLRTINPNMVVQMFYDSSKLYETEILSKNESFFLDHSFEDIQDLDFNLLSKLKEYVRSMSATSKENVWKYVQNLYKLTYLICSK